MHGGLVGQVDMQGRHRDLAGQDGGQDAGEVLPERGDLLRAVRMAVAEFRGAYAIAVISTREPGRVVGARQR